MKLYHESYINFRLDADARAYRGLSLSLSRLT